MFSFILHFSVLLLYTLWFVAYCLISFVKVGFSFAKKIPFYAEDYDDTYAQARQLIPY